MPQYSIRLEAIRYLCTNSLLPAFNDASCHVPATEWRQRYLPCYLFSVFYSGLLFFHVGLPIRTAAPAYWFTHYRTTDVARKFG